MKNPMKLVLALAALSLGLAAPITQAQEGPPPPPPKGEDPVHPKKVQRSPRGERLKMLAEKLNLTTDQQAKITAIVEDEMKAGKALHDDTSLDREAKRSKMEEIRRSHRAQIRAVLTPEQQAKFDEMKEEWGGKGPRKEK